MQRLAVAITPSRLADVCDPSTRELIGTRFDARFAADDLSAPALADLLDGADVVLTSWGTPRLTADLLARTADPARLVVGHAAGTVKNLLDRGALDQGVTVFSAAGRIAWSVGEYCLGAALTLLRRLPQFDQRLRSGEWKPTELRGGELRGRTVGIVGLSSTARAFLTLLAPFGAEVVVYDPYLDPQRAGELGVRSVDLNAVMTADVVSVHVPNVPATEGMIGADQLARIPVGGILINSSRAPAIDTAALVSQIAAGRILAAVDVYDTEPPTLPPELAQAPNVLLTPHIAGDTEQGHLALLGYVLNDIIRWLDDGVRGPCYVDPAVWSIAA
jgi:phosphoglycerate dehydrogenase-like enzyme